MLHLLQIAEMRKLKELKDQNELLDNYLYLKAKVEDAFYMKTGMEQWDFKQILDLMV